MSYQPLQRIRSGARKRGLTLIELLVVVGIVTLLSAITLPTIRTIMSQRKTSQAAILVKNMLEAARARAIARGRPVAVVLERLSSRAERNPTFDSSQPITPANFPLVSTTASATDFVGNYEVYNTCIRMSLAETPPPLVFENVTFNLNGSVLTLGATVVNDSRFANAVRPGAIIEFPDVPAIHRGLMVVSVDTDGNSARDVDGSGNQLVQVDNFSSIPGTMKTEVDNLVIARQSIRPPVQAIPPVGLSAATRMLVQTLPQPIASQIVDMPKGTCIDLSLSGYASDTRWTSPIASVQEIINRRDTRRHFASDWISPTADPSPVALRPVYIVFGGTGMLESIIMNGVSGPAGLPVINKYDAHEDIYLFVGRTDQIVRVAETTTAGLLTPNQIPIFPQNLESERIKANINDSSNTWIRVSPRSGSIAVSSVASAYDTPLPDGTPPTATSFRSIGEVLYRSRMLSFTDGATAQ